MEKGREKKKREKRDREETRKITGWVETKDVMLPRHPHGQRWDEWGNGGRVLNYGRKGCREGKTYKGSARTSQFPCGDGIERRD